MEIFSTKYDGSLHYRFTASVVVEHDRHLVLYRGPGVPLHSYRGSWQSRDRALLVYWADRPFNLAVSWERDGAPRSHYVNVATRSRWDDGVVRFVDLDLDLIWQAGTSEVILDDEDEFEEHLDSYGYPATIIEEAWRAVAEIRELFATATPPFDGHLYDWRPGRPLSLAG